MNLFKIGHKKIVNSPHPHPHTEIQQIYKRLWNNSLGKILENCINRDSTTKCKKKAWRWIGEAEIQAHQGKTHTQVEVIDNQEHKGTKVFLEERKIQAPHQAPQTLDPSQER